MVLREGTLGRKHARAAHREDGRAPSTINQERKKAGTIQMEKACSFGCFLSLGTRRRTRLPQEPPSEFPCSSMLHHPPRPDPSYLLSQSLAKRKADTCFDWTLLWIGGSLSALFACTYNCSSTTADREQLRWGATPMRCIRAYETRATAYTPSPSFPIKLNVHRSIYPLASGVPQRRAPRSCTVFVMTTPPMSTPVREGETIEGSRTMRNRPYPVLKCSVEAIGLALRRRKTC